jgi:hypothetical protein
MSGSLAATGFPIKPGLRQILKAARLAVDRHDCLSMHLPMKTALAAALLAMVCAPAQARTLQIVGTAGYLSEWEIRASADPEPSAVAGEHRGPISWKHVGLCATNGPVEKSGNLKFRISGWGPFSRIDATMSFDQTQCTYSGSYAAQTKGTMDCSDAKGIPITLTIW